MQGKFGDLIHGENDDQNGQLAEAVCRSDLIRLCTFFGKRKSKESWGENGVEILRVSVAIEVICGHMTTLLSQPNWRLRATLFDSLVTVASYIGLESELFIRPLLNQVGIKTPLERYVFHVSVVQGTGRRWRIRRPSSIKSTGLFRSFIFVETQNGLRIPWTSCCPRLSPGKRIELRLTRIFLS